MYGHQPHFRLIICIHVCIFYTLASHFFLHPHVHHHYILASCSRRGSLEEDKENHPGTKVCFMRTVSEPCLDGE